MRPDWLDKVPELHLLTPEEEASLEGASVEEIRAYMAQPHIMARAFKAVEIQLRLDKARDEVADAAEAAEALPGPGLMNIKAPLIDILTVEEKELLKDATPEEICDYLNQPELLSRAYDAIANMLDNIETLH